MRIKFNKEIEFFIKKYFINEKFLLKKRLIRAYKNRYEEELFVLNKIVPQDLDSIDVGVYRGVYTYQLANLSKHVHAFEPNPLIFKYLDTNLRKIIKNLTLYNVALSDQNSTAKLKIPNRHNISNKNNYEELYKLGCATIHKENNVEINFTDFTVNTKKLDDILIEKKIGFIKIDVEGHEQNVLEGSMNLIKKYKPNLLIEIEKRHSNKNVGDTIEYINKLGYKSYFFNGKDLVKTSSLTNLNFKNNFIFLN